MNSFTPDMLPPPPPAPIQGAEREFWLKIRQSLLIQLAAIEDRLGLERSRTPHTHPPKK